MYRQIFSPQIMMMAHETIRHHKLKYHKLCMKNTGPHVVMYCANVRQFCVKF